MDDDVAKTKPAPEPSPHHKLDKEKLERLKETIRKELSKIRLENEAKRQVQKEETKSDDSKKRKHPIERIVWVPKTDGASTTPLQSFQGESETSRRVILKPTQQPRVEKKRETKVLRKCQLCMRSTANMKNHLAFSHLKESWWGVLPDQTCWRCKEYHPLWKITQCEASYMPITHRFSLLCRHREFLEYVMEDFEIESPQELVNIVRSMRLCNSSVSGFTEREEYFLREIDTMYNLPVKHQHSSLMPTRPSELLHWKTITGILMNTRDRGAISSSSTPRKLVLLIDTRCDLLREYEIHNHHGLLNSFPPITAMAGQVKIKSAITELVDPRQQHSPAYNLICGDPMVKIALGIRPDVVQLADRSYMGLCHRMKKKCSTLCHWPDWN